MYKKVDADPPCPHHCSYIHGLKKEIKKNQERISPFQEEKSKGNAIQDDGRSDYNPAARKAVSKRNES